MSNTITDNVTYATLSGIVISTDVVTSVDMSHTVNKITSQYKFDDYTLGQYLSILTDALGGHVE